MLLGALQTRCRAATAYWRDKTGGLPRDPQEPFHSALVALMDKELDLFDRVPVWFRVPLQVMDIVRHSAEVTGIVQLCDQIFGWHPDPRPLPVPPQQLFAFRLKTTRSSFRSCTAPR